MQLKQKISALTWASAGLVLVAGSITNNAAFAQSNQPTMNGSLQGLQSLYFTQPAQHFFAGNSQTTGDGLVQVDFSSLLKPPTNHIYLNGAMLQRSVQGDKALATFWNDPNVGAALRAAAAHPLLVSELPQTPFNGMDAVNSSPSIFRRIRRVKGLKKAASTPPATKAKGIVALRVAAYRLAASTELTNYTTILARNDQGNGYTMFVLGKLPQAIDSSIPVNFTLDARQYKVGTTDAAGNPTSINHTVLDRVELPVSGPGKRYFCFVYQLNPVARSSKETFVASYWASALIAQEQAVGIGRGTGTQVVAVPAIQVNRYFNFSGVNSALINCSMGEPLSIERQKQAILLILQRRKAFFQSHPYAARRLQRRLAALDAGNS